MIKHGISRLKYFFQPMPCFKFDNRLQKQSQSHFFIKKENQEKRNENDERDRLITVQLYNLVL